MATYAIGDVQGCYDSLMKLLDKLHFDSARDQLWFTGDLINRGPQSLKTLRFIQALHPQPICVLGNHDLGLLAVARGAQPFNSACHTFSDVLEADDKEELLRWLEHRPLIHHCPELGYTLVHAGIYPEWDLELALTLAKEVEGALQGPDSFLFYQHLYGDEPNRWHPTLQHYERLRFIVNAFTRMRFCNLAGCLELQTKESSRQAPVGFIPWFNLPNRPTHDQPIIFGHWSSLRGQCNAPHLFALDTGCVWGHALTALRLEDQQRFSIDCHSTQIKAL